MTTYIITVLALVLLVSLSARFVKRDGYGHRPPPRSHDSWSMGALPSEPYRSLR